MEHSSYDFSQVDQSGLAQMTFGILKIRWLMVQNSSIVYLLQGHNSNYYLITKQEKTNIDNASFCSYCNGLLKLSNVYFLRQRSVSVLSCYKSPSSSPSNQSHN